MYKHSIDKRHYDIELKGGTTLPTVKRFASLRTLGQPVLKIKTPADNQQQPTQPIPHKKDGVRLLKTVPRKTRSDKKHRFTLRIATDLWNQIRELSINSGGIEKGASFNVLCIELITQALSNEDIMEIVSKKFPLVNGNKFVRIRTWEDI